MGKTLELRRRIELFSMDRYCENISLALYRRDTGQVPTFLVHTYSARPGARARVEFVSDALQLLVGLQRVANKPGWLMFPCRWDHERAVKRAFLDVCKLEPGTAPELRPLTVFDKKAGCQLQAVSFGDGIYEMTAERQSEAALKRADALARGFVKLCDMGAVEGESRKVSFPCRTQHDAMIGMLMFRAQNLRAAMREAEQAATRGILAAPSRQST